jgi:pheromone shutdown protein TraB
MGGGLNSNPRRPQLPESIPLLVWMVALIPLAFVGLAAAVLLASWCTENGDCHTSNLGLWAWAGGILAAALSTVLTARCVMLAISTAVLVTPFVLLWIAWA